MTLDEAKIILEVEDVMLLASKLECDKRTIYRILRGSSKRDSKIAYVLEYAKLKKQKIQEEVKSYIN